MMLPLVIAVMPEGADRDYMEWLFVEHHRLMMVTAFGIGAAKRGRGRDRLG